MSKLNPYETFLDGRPVDAILAATADKVAKHLAEMGPEKARVPPAPGKWSAAEIVCHLARLRTGIWIPAAANARRGWADHPAVRPGPLGRMVQKSFRG